MPETPFVMPPPPYTKQNMVDNFAEWFLVRKNPLAYSKKVYIGDTYVPLLCRYRMEDGIGRCAIGLHIPDDRYQPAMEADSALPIVRRFCLDDLFSEDIQDEILDTDAITQDAFLTRLQRVHDETAEHLYGDDTVDAPYTMSRLLRNVCESFRLTTPEIANTIIEEHDGNN